MIDISRADKAQVLAALYNAARPNGMGFLHATPEDMTVEEARGILVNGDTTDYCRPQVTYFDYLRGRVMKVDLGGEKFNPFAYDRDNGEGAAARALEDVEGVTVLQD